MIWEQQNTICGDEWVPKAAIHFPIWGIKEAMIQ